MASCVFLFFSPPLFYPTRGHEAKRGETGNEMKWNGTERNTEMERHGNCFASLMLILSQSSAYDMTSHGRPTQPPLANSEMEMEMEIWERNIFCMARYGSSFLTGLFSCLFYLCVFFGRSRAFSPTYSFLLSYKKEKDATHIGCGFASSVYSSLLQ